MLEVEAIESNFADAVTQSLALFLFKIAVPPVLVALMSLAARRWGPTVGGLIMGLPWMTGPVLFFLALDKGEGFAVAASLGIELGVLCIAGYIVGFAVGSAIGPWPVALAMATCGFIAVAAGVRSVDLPLWGAALAGAVSLVGAYLLVPKPGGGRAGGPLPWWDIPARMVTTFVLVAGIMITADRLGPQLSGIVATYPVILTVIGAFTLQQWGRDALLRVLRGISISLLGFVLFFLVAGYAIPVVGLVPSFALAALTGIAFSGSTVLLSRRGQV